jgi:hypothetical protein
VLPTRPTHRWNILIVGLLAGCGSSKSNVPVLELPALGDTVATSYSDVTQAAWLGGNRWAVLAPADNTAAIVDFGTRNITSLAGGSAKTLQHPADLFFAADTLYVGDWGLRRLTLWSSSGRLLGSIPAANSVRGSLPHALDGAGHFYLALYPPAGPDGGGNRDSAAVVRADKAFARADTIARLAPLDIAEVQGDAGRRFERRVFSGTDQWGVIPDGSLWVGRVYDNRVD